MLFDRRDREILLYLHDHQPSTYREVAYAVGLRSSSTVFYRVRRLARLGLITRAGRREYPRRSQSRCLTLSNEVVLNTQGEVGVWVMRERTEEDVEAEDFERRRMPAGDAVSTRQVQDREGRQRMEGRDEPQTLSEGGRP